MASIVLHKMNNHILYISLIPTAYNKYINYWSSIAGGTYVYKLSLWRFLSSKVYIMYIHMYIGAITVQTHFCNNCLIYACVWYLRAHGHLTNLNCTLWLTLTFACMYMYMYLHTYTHTYVCMYVCICMCICTYIRI